MNRPSVLRLAIAIGSVLIGAIHLRLYFDSYRHIDDIGPSFVLNARTDVFLREIGEPAGRLDETKRRAESYGAAGASCLFVPGLLDLDALGELVEASPIPISVLARPGGPTIAELAATGVRRISIGPGISEAAYGLARRAAAELVDSGTYESLDGAIGFPELQSLLAGR